MGWLAFLAAVSAWVPAQSVAKKWGRGVLVPVAAIIGIVSSGIATLGFAALMHYSSPDVFGAGEMVLDALGFAVWSVFISPIAAIVGWRRAKNPPPLTAPSTLTRGAFDILKRK